MDPVADHAGHHRDRIAAADGAAAVVDGADGRGIGQHNGGAGQQVVVLGIADANAGYIGDRVPRTGRSQPPNVSSRPLLALRRSGALPSTTSTWKKTDTPTSEASIVTGMSFRPAAA